jgi:hypothetical protein
MTKFVRFFFEIKKMQLKYNRNANERKKSAKSISQNINSDPIIFFLSFVVKLACLLHIENSEIDNKMARLNSVKRKKYFKRRKKFYRIGYLCL